MIQSHRVTRPYNRNYRYFRGQLLRNPIHSGKLFWCFVRFLITSSGVTQVQLSFPNDVRLQMSREEQAARGTWRCTCPVLKGEGLSFV